MTKATLPTADEVRALLHYDPETGLFTWKAGRSIGMDADVVKHQGYSRIPIKGKLYNAHRLAWVWVYGEWPKEAVDHINRVRHDNRIVNLRAATTGQNSFNMKGMPFNTSGFKGVGFHKDTRKFGAYIHIRNKMHWLGVFVKPEDAAMAYDRAAQYFFGEFAATNYAMGRL